MILDILKKYSQIIVKYEIVKFNVVGTSYYFVCQIELKDKTKLFVRDYLFIDGTRKYSFHWQDIQNKCILRWDNTPHHQNLNTFPYHKHIGNEEIIQESQPMSLEMVLEFISEKIIQ